MTKLIRFTLVVINVLAVLALLLVKVGTFINPNTWLLPSYAALGLFPVLLLNIVFISIWLIARRWWFVLSLLAIVVCYSEVKSSYVINFNRDGVDNYSDKITLLSYNTMTLGNLKKEKKDSSNEVIRYILNTDADIVCLQEFAYSKGNNLISRADIMNLFKKYPYKHIRFQKEKWNMGIGVATFSKYPIINMQTLDYEINFNLSIFSDIVIGTDTVRVVNNHLESNRITSKDISETSKLGKSIDPEKIKEMTKYFSRKLGVAYKVRAKQAVAVSKVIENSPYKVINCGDHNDVPSSYTYSKIKGDKLKDAFVEAGSGLGLTFEEMLYRFRIDFIMCDKSFGVDNFRIGKLRSSDHYPIQTDIYLSKKE